MSADVKRDAILQDMVAAVQAQPKDGASGLIGKWITVAAFNRDQLARGFFDECQRSGPHNVAFRIVSLT